MEKCNIIEIKNRNYISFPEFEKVRALKYKSANFSTWILESKLILIIFSQCKISIQIFKTRIKRISSSSGANNFLAFSIYKSDFIEENIQFANAFFWITCRRFGIRKYSSFDSSCFFHETFYYFSNQPKILCSWNKVIVKTLYKLL